MFPLWELVIAPVLAAAEARTVVEVGALRGDTTRLVMDTLGPQGVLHVIDPVPGFDPADHEAAFPGRYVFHRGLSLSVLPDIPTPDAALLDGDHNWYTVSHELRLITEGARAGGAPLPVLVLHDVGWPYGRRDLYYDPAAIPPQHRHPHRRAGMRPGRAELLRDGQGMNQGLNNAEHEGGPANGVMTALEDFVAAHDQELRVVVAPLYFGLAIVAEASRLERIPGLAAELDRLESAEGRRAQVELGERIRLRAVAHHHTLARRRSTQVECLAGRYLAAVERDLDPAATGRLERLRRALDSVQAEGTGGDVVLVVGPDPTPVAFAVAHLVANEDDRRLWCAVLSGPDGVVLDATLPPLLARLDLPGAVPIRPLDEVGAALDVGLVYVDPGVPVNDRQIAAMDPATTSGILASGARRLA